MRKDKTVFWLVLISFFLLPYVLSAQVNASISASSDVIPVEENYSTAQENIDAASSGSIEVDQTFAGSFQENLTGTIKGGGQMLQVSSSSNSSSFSQHMMCKDYQPYWNGTAIVYIPIDPTTIFRPSDTSAVILTTVFINDTMEFRWYYRSNSSKTWVSAFNWSDPDFPPLHLRGTYREYPYAAYLNISGFWPAYHYPRAYKVDVHLDGSLSPAFSEFFEVTNGGLNSPRMCEYVDVNGTPVNMKSRFTIGNDTEAYHNLRFDKIAYFNDNLTLSHNFTTVWIQPNGSTYKTYSGNFSDYKDTNVTWNYWEYNYTSDDYISINSSTPVGNWTVEVYLDSYLNKTWMPYGPIATTPFIVGNETVADWTFMVYLDADNNLEWAGIENFLDMANVSSSSKVNVVVQMDRHPGYDSYFGYDDRFGNWTDCKRFNVTEGMWPTPGNATLDLGEVNMGHNDTLKDFVNWTINNYPANYYFLVLWDHGIGSMGICFDFTDAYDCLNLTELSQALSGLPTIMDVVFLDACSMSMTEVAYQIKDYANVLVGPEGIGWAPAPYDEYLLSLTSNSSMLPSAFAREVVSDYINWCNSEVFIQNATMSAIDLTKITSLTAAIDDFALKLKEKETPYHEEISLARNRTEGYQGPYADESGYYIDLYHFAQLTYQYVLDEELQNTADQVMTTLESMIIIEADKARPDSHGLSIFFPDEKGKYEDYESEYEETNFVEDNLWDEFVINHLSGYVLTIQTPYPDISVKVNETSYTTDADGKIRVFVLPDDYTVNVTTPVYNITGPGSRGVFTQWNDGNMSNPRTLFVNSTLTLEAEYETRYEVTFDQLGVGADFTETVVTIDGTGYNDTNLPVSFWWGNDTIHSFAFQSPLTATPNAKRYAWNSTSGLSSLQSDSITVSMSGNIIGNYKTQYEVTLSQSGVGTDFTGTVVTVDGTEYKVTGLPVPFWWDFNSTHTFDFQSPLVVTINAKQYVWNSTSGLSSLQSGSINVSMSGSVIGDYKTQYYLTMSTNLGTVNPGSGWHDAGSTVQISASSPDVVDGEQYVWLGWTGTGDGNYAGMDNPATITMNSPINEIASWRHEYRLIIGMNFGTTNPSAGEHWYEADSTVDISVTAPSATSGEQYVWLGWTGTGSGSYSNTDNPASITMNGHINETAAWRHEYYLIVTSLYDSPTPTSGWYEAGKSIAASITSPVSGQTGTRYVSTGWTGTGSVSMSGTTTSVIFTINASSSITWNWKTQYLLSVRTNPTGLSLQPNTSPQGPWYDNGTLVNCTAQEISGRVFDHWTVDGASWDPGIDLITVTMDGPYEATAHYVRASAWWETLFRPEILQVILGLVGIVLSVTFVGTAWVRTRRKKAVTKALLNQINEIYSRFKMNPQECEEELYRLRNTILEDLTDGKITQENYDIMNKRIEKYIEELRKKNDARAKS